LVNPDKQTDHWWDPVPVESGDTAILTLGPLIVKVHRGSDEWLVAWEREDDNAEPVRASMLRSRDEFQADSYNRYVTCSASGIVSVKPLLADRPVVIRPRQPVFVLPGEDTTLYISSPVWIRIEAGDPPQSLQQISVLRLSDTWFGASTREGELCYAARTHARKALEEVIWRPHRVVTPVRIHNRAHDALPIEKLSLPVPLLSTYGDRDGSLWTESVSLTRAAEADMAVLRITPGAPSDARDAKLLTGPREIVEKGGLVRAFSGLFG
jgi:hypothetical protein